MPQRTINEIDEAIDRVSKARRELDAAMTLIRPIHPTLATLLDDDILRLAQRRQKIADLRLGCCTNTDGHR